MRDMSKRSATATDEAWQDDDALCYTVVQTPGGYLAVVLAADEGQLVYNARLLFPTAHEAAGDLHRRVVAGGGELDGLRYITSQALFTRLMALLVRRERAWEPAARAG